jgi:uncharacterized protein
MSTNIEEMGRGGTRLHRMRGRLERGGAGLGRAVGWPVLVWMGLVLVAGCGPSSSGATGTGAGRVATNEIREAQPRLATVRVWLGAHELTAEVARTPRELETGMMFRTNIAEDEGMLFVFPRAGQVAFWMKNVPIPLSCAYIDPEGVILELHDLEPHEETAVEAGSYRIQYVLETARGWFDRHGVGTGTVVRTERGTLRESFGTGIR